MIVCKKPAGITNGNVQGTDFSYGKSVVYICNTGYRLTGSNRRTCTESGGWNTGEPACHRELNIIVNIINLLCLLLPFMAMQEYAL